MKDFEPDYRHVVDAAWNRRPARLPIYEHKIDFGVMAEIMGEPVPPPEDEGADLAASYAAQCRFWKRMTYDTVSFEAKIAPRLPGHGAIYGSRPGPIQSRRDLSEYPFDEFPAQFWAYWGPHLDALAAALPPGMKAVGGCGWGVFEISEDLVGYEPLCLMQYDDPDLFSDLYVRIGDLMVKLWSDMVRRYDALFAVYRMGDDLGFKSATLLAPETIVSHVVPQYRRILSVIRGTGKPFLLHSCGKIFAVMEDLIAAGIQAKHSNEDAIAPFEEWIERYGERIGLFGGIDVDVLCLRPPEEVFQEVLRRGTAFRRRARGFALGSGNSIPEYVPAQGYLAMIEAAKEIRRREEG